MSGTISHEWDYIARIFRLGMEKLDYSTGEKRYPARR